MVASASSAHLPPPGGRLRASRWLPTPRFSSSPPLSLAPASPPLPPPASSPSPPPRLSASAASPPLPPIRRLPASLPLPPPLRLSSRLLLLWRWDRWRRVKYVGDEEEQNGLQMTGLNLMDKTLAVQGARIAFSIWDVAVLS
ncbi:hypothetical protein GUJ93_ZPchr0012g19983 [Zizania palustris]|uniref:Uncharacterized protein n=1 Tax=Zizania palustris TaxID=103762 RepID=A0A8J5WMP7_ZIZPA|nr:hypothetical protein GUJ93_ZPchr0012g19983 [Zizania palustris]